MLSWLIIGGGLHGTYLSRLLTARLSIAPHRLRVVDPHARPLAVWRRRTLNCGMTHLRSPATHNIDLGIMSLHHFVRGRGGPSAADFIPPYYRPRLALFNAHCDAVIEENGLDELRLEGWALSAQPVNGGLRVETTNGDLTTKRLVLATGSADTICWPDWAVNLRGAGARVDHIFDTGFRRLQMRDDGDRITVVGGGISAAQSALALVKQMGRPVRLLSRHPLAESQFDFDPCWIGPKCLTDFNRQPYKQRRTIVDAARLPGTLPSEVLQELQAALRRGEVTLITGEIEAARYHAGRIQLTVAGEHLETDRIILATGFTPTRPGGALVDQLIARFGLPVTPEGYPVVDRSLAWNARIYVTGALAELQVGPCARNIVGIRNAGRLLLGSVEVDGR